MCSGVSLGTERDLSRSTIVQWSVTREKGGLEQVHNCAVAVTRERGWFEQVPNCAVECHQRERVIRAGPQLCSGVSPGREGDLSRSTIVQWSVTRERGGLEQVLNRAPGREGDLSRSTIVQWGATSERGELEQVHNCALGKEGDLSRSTIVQWVSPGRQGDLSRSTIVQWSVIMERKRDYCINVVKSYV